MERKYTVLVVNDIFEDDNMLIIKSKGSQYINRLDENITPEVLKRELSRSGIEAEDCDINVINSDWNGVPKIAKF